MARPTTSDPLLVDPTGPSERQLDLFHDAPSTVAANKLAQALSARDIGGSRAATQRLAALAPDHAWLREAWTLVAVLQAPDPKDPEEGFEWIRSLERDWRPAAEAVLGPDRSGDFLAPVWRRIARAIESAPFDPASPERHASWACRQARDWDGLRRSVLSVEAYETAPVLLERLAEAEWRLGERAGAMDHWFTLCWQAPAHFERIVEAPAFPAEALARAWRRALDEDMEEDWSPEWFPAWLLIAEPALARQSASSGGADAAQRAFVVVRSLLDTPATGARQLTLRAELKALHPGLLAAFLRKYR